MHKQYNIALQPSTEQGAARGALQAGRAGAAQPVRYLQARSTSLAMRSHMAYGLEDTQCPADSTAPLWSASNYRLLGFRSRPHGCLYMCGIIYRVCFPHTGPQRPPTGPFIAALLYSNEWPLAAATLPLVLGYYLQYHDGARRTPAAVRVGWRLVHPSWPP